MGVLSAYQSLPLGVAAHFVWVRAASAIQSLKPSSEPDATAGQDSQLCPAQIKQYFSKHPLGWEILEKN